jgi:hypothetical protein
VVNGDRIIIELVEPPDSPPILVITWPGKGQRLHANQLPGCCGDHQDHR